MNVKQSFAAEAISEVNPAALAQRLQALAARPQSLSVRDLIDRYMAVYAGADTTRAQRLAAWSVLIGEFTLEQVDSDLMHAGRAELAKQPPLVFLGLDHQGRRIFKPKGRAKAKTPATLNRYMVAMAAVFTWAIEERLAPRGWVNPCRGIKRLREPDGRVRFLDEAERGRLFAACQASQYPRLYALALMAMLTGARMGELLALCWRQVDLLAGVATLGKTKNGDRRTLVLLPHLVEVLRPFLGDRDRYVFGSVRSRFQAPARIDSAWRDAVARAQVRDFKFHDLRHCCASYLAQAGTPLNVIAEVLGHRKLDMSRRYAHLTTQTKASAMRHALGGIGGLTPGDGAGGGRKVMRRNPDGPAGAPTVTQHGVTMPAAVWERIEDGLPPSYTEEEFRAYSAIGLARESCTPGETFTDRLRKRLTRAIDRAIGRGISTGGDPWCQGWQRAFLRARNGGDR